MLQAVISAAIAVIQNAAEVFAAVCFINKSIDTSLALELVTNSKAISIYSIKVDRLRD
jgi:hypothetical protein